MADHSGIEWTEASWPVTTGCKEVSPGCDNCYAAQLTSGRLAHLPEYAGLAVGGTFTGEVRTHPHRLGWPLRWRKPRRIFVCSMSDLFHDGVPNEFIARVFAVMACTPEHTYQVLTKRHGRMRALLSRGELGAEGFPDMVEEAMAEFSHAELDRWPLPNVWCGVSVENQQWADIRIPALLDTPAAVRWLSCEPLLGPVTLNPQGYCWCGSGEDTWTCCRKPVGWVVVGGESGPKARPMNPDWAASLVEQCQRAGVPVFMKQMGSRWGKEHHNIDRFPEQLRVREYPAVQVTGGRL